MTKVAIIQFPGSNCEYEARRAVNTAGMKGVLVRWNEDYEKIRQFDAYILPGGFSYEDRVRSGAIAARDPVMNVIKEEAEKGKPVLGICNGAQILVEAGMIPGVRNSSQPPLTLRGGDDSSSPLKIRGAGGVMNNGTLQAALAANNHGWLNIWVSITNDTEPGRTPFNNYPQGHHFRLPIAHGEGRFVIPEGTLKQLIANGQTVFRYCGEQGSIVDEFPVNPNGAVYNLAGVSNPEGNVVALMPHPERVKEGQVIFESLRKYLERHTPPCPSQEGNQTKSPPPEGSAKPGVGSHNIGKCSAPENALELYVDLIITDNEAITLGNALRQMGFESVNVEKKIHWEIEVNSHADTESTIQRLITSGELLNTNKEAPYLRAHNKWYRYKDNALQEIPALVNEKCNNLLIRYNEDYEGEGKTNSLQGLGFKEVTAVKKGVVWQIEAERGEWEKIMETNILFNPYSQNARYL